MLAATSLLMVACTDDYLIENPNEEAGKGIGQMVLFTAGRTNNSITTRADGGADNYSETPGATYYMPDAYRFVCRMYYKSQPASDDFDLTNNAKSVAWLKVDGNMGNSLYWNRNYADVDTSVKGDGGVDDYGNDYSASFFYWQNRREHAFLAWTDLNKATNLTYTNGLKMDADMIYEEHTGVKRHQPVVSGYSISGVSGNFTQIDDDFVNYVKTHYETLKETDIQKSEISALSSAYGYHSEKIASYSKPLNCVRYSYNVGQRHDESYVPGEPADEDHLVSYYQGPYLLWIWGDGQELEYTLQSGDVVDSQPNADGDYIVRNSASSQVALKKKIYVDAGTPDALFEEVADPTPENPEHKTTKYYIYKYLATFASGKFHYDFSQTPKYCVAMHKYYVIQESEVVNEHNVNKFDLTSDGKTSISQQPDIVQALTIQAPQYATQSLNRVNLYFKHQFSQIQVNLKSASDSSVTLNADDIKKVELLGVSEEGYIFSDLDETGKVHPAAYKDVVISDYTEEQLQANEYGTSLELFDMNPSKEDHGYPTGYLKSFNGITFGQLKAIRITWTEHDTSIDHQAVMKVTDQRLSALKSGYKYIWNVELRRGTLATLRVEIVDWIVPNDDLKYDSNGTIDEADPNS